MSASLIEELPKIVAEGKKEVERILERLASAQKLSLQTNELVLPSKDVSGLFRGKVPDVGAGHEFQLIEEQQKTLAGFEPRGQLPLGAKEKAEWLNRLVYGDNLLVMQALLAGDPPTGLPSMRGMIDLIYIDPPFDSKADYRTKITLPGKELQQKPTVLEQAAYADTWKDGTVSYLRMMYPRLALMRELLSDHGSIYVHIDWHVGHYVKVLMDDIFGKENFENEIIWQKCNSKNFTQYGYSNIHDTLYFYRKSIRDYFSPEYIPLNEDYVRRSYRHVEKDGRPYRILPLHAPGVSKGSTGQVWKGMVPPTGNHWRYIPDTLDEMDAKGLIIISTNGVPGYKKYLDDSDGIRPGTIWTDIKQLPPS